MAQDESDDDDDNDESAGSEGEEEAWIVQAVQSVKYFNTKKRKGWHAFIEWEGDFEPSFEPMTNLLDSACKYFGLVELFLLTVTNLKLCYEVDDVECLKRVEISKRKKAKE